MRADRNIVWFLMSCSEAMLKKQPVSEKPVEASVLPSSDMTKTENDAADV